MEERIEATLLKDDSYSVLIGNIFLLANVQAVCRLICSSILSSCI
jgi:hypothetical protein